MAVTSYGVNDPLAVKLWAKKLAVEVLKNTWVTRFMGADSSSVVQVRDELNKSAGDRVTYGLRMQLLGAGVIGDAVLAGNEESLLTYTDSVVVDQLRHAVRSAGKMSQQRVPFSIREEALSGLRDWWTDRMDVSFFNQICGNTAQTSLQFTGLQATSAPDASHRLDAAIGTTDQALTSAQVFNLTMIDRAIERARTLSPAIRPAKVAGKEFWPIFLHPFQVTDLRTSTSSGQWLDIQKAALQGGEITDNPIFDGSLGVYNGAILHSDVRVTTGCDSGTPTTAVSTVRRAVMAGAQSAMVAFGRDNGPERYTWVEELFDYQNELGVSAGAIFGMKKTVFNSLDFATIVLSSYAVQH